MTDIIKYNYNLEVKKLEEKDEKYFFTVNGMQFMLIPCYRTTKELEELYEVCEELKKYNIPIHTFILNKEAKLITQIYKTNYILFKIEEPEKEYNILDILNFMNKIHLTKSKSDLYRNQWGKLWSEKIDYFEFQIHELGKEKKMTINSLTYYIGLAENAISYVINAMKKYNSIYNNSISLCHKRINFPNLSIDYLNPLNFIFDLKVRDIAEYIKSIFFVNEEDAWIELNAFLNIEKFSEWEYEMFYARLLYPSYYFDIYEQVMNKQKDEKEMLKYIKKASEYEEFLKKVYKELTKKAPIDKVDWLLK